MLMEDSETDERLIIINFGALGVLLGDSLALVLQKNIVDAYSSSGLIMKYY